MSDVAPTLPTACGLLPPEGAVPPKGGLLAGLTSTLSTACGSLPPRGPLRLRPGEAGSAALLA